MSSRSIIPSCLRGERPLCELYEGQKQTQSQQSPAVWHRCLGAKGAAGRSRVCHHSSPAVGALLVCPPPSLPPLILHSRLLLLFPEPLLPNLCLPADLCSPAPFLHPIQPFPSIQHREVLSRGYFFFLLRIQL